MVSIRGADYLELIKKQGRKQKLLYAPKAAYSTTLAIGRIPKPKMTSVEAEYASILAERCRRGEVLWWKFEAMTLVLKDFDIEEREVRYTPDFDIMLANGEFEFVETKGPHIREDSWQKLKIAASLFPMRFVMEQRDKEKNWHRTVI
jgi:hypothetical protein